MSRPRVLAMVSAVSAVSALAPTCLPQAAGAGSVTVIKPVNVTHDLFLR
jgi:hypothetical protein